MSSSDAGGAVGADILADSVGRHTVKWNRRKKSDDLPEIERELIRVFPGLPEKLT